MPGAHTARPQYAFNLFSHTTKIGDNGYNEEEMKLVKETRKIWGVRGPAARARLAAARMMSTIHHYRPEPRLRPMATTVMHHSYACGHPAAAS